MLIVSLDQYIVVVARPKIGQELNFSGQTLQAVISAYAVTSAGFLLLGAGRLTCWAAAGCSWPGCVFMRARL
jgi:hypothetical protein